TAAMTTILIARLYRYSTRRNTRKMPPATLGSSPTKVAPTARAARSPRIRWPATPLLWRCRAGATRAPPNAHRAARAPHRAPVADRGDHVVARPAARELEHARHLLVLAREPRVGVGERDRAQPDVAAFEEHDASILRARFSSSRTTCPAPAACTRRRPKPSSSTSCPPTHRRARARTPICTSRSAGSPPPTP